MELEMVVQSPGRTDRVIQTREVPQTKEAATTRQGGVDAHGARSAAAERPIEAGLGLIREGKLEQHEVGAGDLQNGGLQSTPREDPRWCSVDIACYYLFIELLCSFSPSSFRELVSAAPLRAWGVRGGVDEFYTSCGDQSDLIEGFIETQKSPPRAHLSFSDCDCSCMRCGFALYNIGIHRH